MDEFLFQLALIILGLCFLAGLWWGMSALAGLLVVETSSHWAVRAIAFSVHFVTVLCAGYGALHGKHFGFGWWSAVLLLVVFLSWFRMKGGEDAAVEATLHEKIAEEHERTAKQHLEDARKLEKAYLHERQDEIIATLAGRPLRERLEHAIWVGGPDLETADDWRDRKRAAVDARLRLWQARDNRYGMVLLDLVKQQGDVCGDPAKNPQKHGCGCWLLAMPPGTVHVDHITPRHLGGTDKPNNLQALCHSCNLVKGTKTERPHTGAQQGLSL